VVTFDSLGSVRVEELEEKVHPFGDLKQARGMIVRACVRVYWCACVCSCVRARVLMRACACAREGVSALACAHACVRVCSCMRVRVLVRAVRVRA